MLARIRATLIVLVAVATTAAASPAGARPEVRSVPQRVIVWDGVTEAQVGEMLARFDGRLIYRYEIIDGIALEVDASTTADVLAYAAARGLRAEPETTVQATLTNSTKPIQVKGSGGAWAANHTGAGVTIAVIDTGIDASHAALDDLDDNPSTTDPKVLAFRDYVNAGGAAVTPYDDNGHGTHVSGIAAGTGAGSSGDGPGGRASVGVAYKANLVGLKVLDGLGSGTSTNIIAAINWVKNNANSVSPPIRVINMSLGVSGTNNGNSATSQAVDAASAAGIVTAAAAGNGTSNGATPNLESGNVNIPADARTAIAVCSSNSADPPTYSNWDSEGPTADGRMKPDVCAPGDSVQSADEGTGSGYRSNGGTSMASPHVAGIAAMIVAAVPSITPAEVRSVLQETALHASNPNNDRGWGEARAKAAIDLAITRAGGQVPPLVANAGGPYTVPAGGTTTVFASVTGGLAPFSYAWDLDGDGDFDDATGASALYHAGSGLGTHTIAVRISDAASPTNVDTDTATVSVVPAAAGGWLQFRGDAARTGSSATPAGIQAGRQLQSATLPGPVTGSPLIADLDGDGVPEIIVGADRTSPGRVSVHAFRQGGSGLQQLWRYDLATALPGGQPTEGFITLGAGDLDLDGDLEIVAYANHVLNAGAVTSNEGRITVLSHTGQLVAEVAGSNSVVIGRRLPPAIGDVDGDGRPDIVVVRQTGGTAGGDYLYALALTGSTLTPIFDRLIAPSLVNTPPALAQLDPATPGEEIIVARQSASNAGQVWVCTVSSCGSPVTTPTGVRGLAVADLDGDGRLEIAANGVDLNSTMVLEASPFSLAASSADGYLWNSPSLGDVDGDGRPDIVNVQHSDWTNDVFHDGDVQVRGYNGAIVARGDLERLGDVGASVQGEHGGALLDFTGSAAPEFVFGTENNRLEAIRFGATGAPAALWGLALPGRPSPVALGDVTGDGFAEIVLGSGSSVVVVGNRAPVLAPIGNRVADVGETVAFTVSASDPDGDPVTLSASNLPPGAIFQPATGSFSFTPSDPGVVSGIRFIASDGALVDHEEITINVGGQVPGRLVATPTALSFGPAMIGAATPAQVVTVQNEGPGVVTPGAPTIQGLAASDFALVGGSCAGQPLAAGAQCQLSVSFAPTVLGARSASLVLPNDGSGGAIAVSLAGTGQGVASVSAQPSSLDFGTVNLGSSPSSSVAIKNTGTDAAIIGTPSLGGSQAADFAVVSDGCAGRTLAPASSCQVLVRFRPGATGLRSASLRVPHSAGPDVTVPIGGAGSTGTPRAALNRSSANLGSQWVGGTTAAVTIAITNAGDGALSLGATTLSGDAAGDFPVSQNGCASTVLAVGASCTLRVSFAPTATGARTATLSVASNATGAPHEVALIGTGTKDETAPAATITTGSNAVLIRGVHRVTGRATDDLSGVGAVSVTFTHPDGPVTVQASVSCNAERTACSWTAAPVSRRGQTEVRVTVTDRAGLSGQAGPVSVLVL